MSEPWRVVHITRESNDPVFAASLEEASEKSDLWVVLDSKGSLLTTEADARLIAAAPMLLAALKEIRDEMAAGHENNVEPICSEAIAGVGGLAPSALTAPHPSHTLVSVPDRHSKTCSVCGKSEFDPTITDSCPTLPVPTTEIPGHDEDPDPPEPDIEDELEEEATDHANETGHGVDTGS